jgi:plastocyanin
MTTRAATRPGFLLIALAFAAVSLGLVHAAAPPPAVATGTIRGTVTLPASALGRRPSVSRPGGTSAADRQQDALDRQTSVVYLDNMPRGMAGEFVERKARLDQRGQRFVPHIVAIGVGGTVDFPNSDPFFHNVFSLSDVRSFDLGRYATGKSKAVRFDKPGVIRVFCDIHAHMSAFIFVFAHPYFDVTDGQGRFRIDGIPAGTHSLVLWNETIEPETRQVTVPDGGEVEVHFAISAAPAPK